LEDQIELRLHKQQRKISHRYEPLVLELSSSFELSKTQICYCLETRETKRKRRVCVLITDSTPTCWNDINTPYILSGSRWAIVYMVLGLQYCLVVLLGMLKIENTNLTFLN